MMSFIFKVKLYIVVPHTIICLYILQCKLLWLPRSVIEICMDFPISVIEMCLAPRSVIEFVWASPSQWLKFALRPGQWLNLYGCPHLSDWICLEVLLLKIFTFLPYEQYHKNTISPTCTFKYSLIDQQHNQNIQPLFH